MILSLALAAGAVAPTSTPVPAAADKLICRRTIDTGSLVKGRRECFTKAQWEQIAVAARAGAASAVENNQGRPAFNEPLVGN